MSYVAWGNGILPSTKHLYLLLEPAEDELFQTAEAQGNCKVMCFHPYSDLTLALMSHDEVRTVIDKWAELDDELGKQFTWVQVGLSNCYKMEDGGLSPFKCFFWQEFTETIIG